MKKSRNMKERIFALLLALAMIAGVMPQNMMVAKAAAGDPVKVEIQVENSYDQSKLSQFDLEIERTDATEEKISIDETDIDPAENKYFVELKEGGMYSYTATADGYVERTGTIEVQTENDPVKIPMDLAAIQVNTSSLSLRVGEVTSLSVSNPVNGATYTWGTEDSSVAAVSNGTVTAEGKGNTNITVSYKDETTKVPIAVSQYETKVELTADPENGADITKVELKAKVTEGTNNVNEGSVTFKMGDSELGTSNVTNGEATCTYQTDAGQYLNGKVTFTATYNGTTKYATSNDTADQTYASTSDITVSAEGLTDNSIVFNPEQTTQFQLNVGNVQERELEYLSLDSDVAEVSNTGLVTVKKPGDIEIKVTASATDTYNTSTYTFTAIAQQKVTMKDLEWQPVSKVYDGNVGITITGSVPSSLQIDNKVASYTFEGSFDNINVGDNKQITISGKPTISGDSNYYSLDWDDATGSYTRTDGSITAKKVTLSITEDVPLSYGQNLKTAVESKNLVQADGMISNDEGKYTFTATLADGNYYVNPEPYSKAVIPGKVNYNETDYTLEASGTPVGNYNFIFEDTGKKALKVTRQEVSDTDLKNALELTANDSTLAEMTADGNLEKIYVRNNSVLQFKIKEESAFADYYDAVMIKFPNWESYQDAAKGANVDTDTLSDGQLNNVEIYFALNGQSNTYTVSNNSTDQDVTDQNVIKGNNLDCIYIDNTAPEIELGDLEKTIISKMEQNITFGFFSNAAYTASVTAEDKPEDNNAGVVDQIQYYVWHLDSEGKTNYESVKGTDLSADAVEGKVNSLKEEDWSSTAEGQIPVVGNADAIEQGYYLLFVRVYDQIGNGETYVSNGMVFETQAPSVIINGITDGDINNTDTEYSITITEPEEYVSGIGRLEVLVTKTENGGETVKEEPGEAQSFDNTKTYEDSYIIDFRQEISGDGSTKTKTYELNEFEDWKNITVNGKVTANNNISTDITIEVKAYDNAGNCLKNINGEETWVTKTFQIDKKAPEINVSFEDSGVKNDKYFNDDRVMTIEYTERNLDKDCLEFEVSLGGSDQGKMKLDDLLALSKGGYEISLEEGTKDAPFTETGTGDDKIWTLKLRFGHDKDLSEDAEYEIIPYCKDKAGNENVELDSESAKECQEFIIDTKAPEITVAYSVDTTDSQEAEDVIQAIKASAGNENARAYTNKTVSAAITINEKNFWISQDNFGNDQKNSMIFPGIAGVDLEGQDVLAENPIDSEWSGNVGEYSCKLDFVGDANYTFGFEYVDLAGNEAVYTDDVKPLADKPHYFTVDKTAPTGSITVTTNDGTNVWRTLLNALTFGAFDKFSNSIPVSLTGEDVTAGVAKIQYYNSTSPKTYDEIAALSESSWKDGTSYDMDADQQFVPYLKVTDRAGNVEYISTTSGFIADQTKPQITITEANRNAASNGIYNEDVILSVKVEDPTNGGTYSGLQSVTYHIQASGNVSTSEDGSLHTAAQNVQSHKTVNGTITVDADKFNSNDVTVTVYATDFSGNEWSEDISLKIDSTAPTIDVTYDLNSPLNDRYYNQTRTATVTVTERNFDPSAVRFNITNTDGTQPSISGWSNSSNSGVSDSATHTCTVTFAADGDYTFTLNTTDLAGNDSNYTRVDEFTIDQTDPTIQVSYDNNNDAESGYFNADRTATITVTEHNFNAAEVNTAITASLEGRGVSTPGLGGWSTRGDVHTASVTFSADADYTFDMDYTDLAGNAAADYEQDSFTVDQTAPELEFFDIEDKSANNDVVAPGVRYSDNNYTENGVEITLEGANHGEMELDGDRSSIPNGESIKMADFERTKENDDLYTMTAVIRDRAGNETEDSVIFSVNRFGSVFVLSDETQELVDNYYTNEEQNLVVTEINVDSLVFNGISYGRDGELVNLEAGTDYEVKASGSEVSWKQYDYTINKENFEKEGNYTVTIDSEDRATNVGNSRAKGCDIEFAIDKTAPTVVITGIEDDAQYRANTRNITVNAADNIAMGDVGVYLGDSDKPVQSYDAKDIQAAGGELTYTMSSSNSRQDIRAVATDAAGNTAEAEITRVLLTSNLFVQFYSNTPLLVGSIAGVVVIAGGLLWFFLIFKKKKEKEQANK